MRPEGVPPNRDLIRSDASLKSFSRAWREFLRHVEALHPGAQTIDVVPAVPLSAAVELGRAHSRRASAPGGLGPRQRHLLPDDGDQAVKFTKCLDHFLEDKVNLNPTRMDLLDTRITAIVNFLKGDEVFGPLLKTMIPQGSYAQKTIIRPRADGTFDTACWSTSIPCPTGPGASTSASSTPPLAAAASTRTCATGGPGAKFRVDLVPYVEIDGRGYITNRHTGDREFTHTKGFTGWLKDRNRDADGHLIKTIRLLKYVATSAGASA